MLPIEHLIGTSQVCRATILAAGAEHRPTAQWMVLAAEALRARRKPDALALCLMAVRVARTVEDANDARVMLAILRGGPSGGRPARKPEPTPIQPSPNAHAIPGWFAGTKAGIA